MSVSSKLAQRLKPFHLKTNVFAEHTALATQHAAVNLGQGFPALPIADFILDALRQAAAATDVLAHQYARSEAHPRLAKGTMISAVHVAFSLVSAVRCSSACPMYV